VGEAGGAAVMVWLRLRPADLLGRMRERSAGRDRAKLDDEERYLARTDLGPPVVRHLAIDASADTADQCENILASLP
jgi:hypothetical protein